MLLARRPRRNLRNRIEAVTNYLFALGLTIGIELLIAAVIRAFAPKLRAQPTLSTCLCVNLLTHPLAGLAHLGLSLSIPPIELAVIVAEAIAYRQVAGLPVKWSISLSLLTNVASMSVGLLSI